MQNNLIAAEENNTSWAKSKYAEHRLLFEITLIPRFIYWALILPESIASGCNKTYAACRWLTSTEANKYADSKNALVNNAGLISSQTSALGMSMLAAVGPFLLANLISLSRLHPYLVGTGASNVYNIADWKESHINLTLNIVLATYGLLLSARSSQKMNGSFVTVYAIKMRHYLTKSCKSRLAMCSIIIVLGSPSALIPLLVGWEDGENLHPAIGVFLAAVNFIVYDITRSIAIYEAVYALVTGELGRGIAMRNFVCQTLEDQDVLEQEEALLQNNGQPLSEYESLIQRNAFAQDEISQFNPSKRNLLAGCVFIFTLFSFSFPGYKGFLTVNSAILHINNVSMKASIGLGFFIASFTAMLYAKNTLLLPLQDARLERTPAYIQQQTENILAQNPSWKELLSTGNNLDFAEAVFSAMGIMLLVYKSIEGYSNLLEDYLHPETKRYKVFQLLVTLGISYFAAYHGGAWINLAAFRQDKWGNENCVPKEGHEGTRKEALIIQFLNDPDCVNAREFSPCKSVLNFFNPRHLNNNAGINMDGEGNYQHLNTNV